jgi:uroporphyrinogen-III synthase
VIEPNQALGVRTILVAPDAPRELTTDLIRHGARVITWPQVQIGDPDSYIALDEAIQNLFGYDWLIFANGNAASFFLRRLQRTACEISDLDALRVCALDDTTRQTLEESQVHVDVVPESPMTENVLAAIETYVVGRDALRGLNFLLPRAAISHDLLRPMLEDAGARVDIVTAYRAVSDNAELTRLSGLLAGGGVDGIAFSSPAAVRVFARIFDTSDLSRLLKEVAVACVDEGTAQIATEFGIGAQIVPSEPGVAALVSALAAHLGVAGH